MAFVNQEIIRPEKVEIYNRLEKGVSPDIWYAKLRIGKEETKRQSLKTKNKGEAEALACDLWEELNHKHKKGYSLNTTQLRKVASDYLSDYQMNVELKESLPIENQDEMESYSRNVLNKQTKIIRTFIIPILGDKNLTEVNADDIKDYIKTRKYWWVNGEGSLLENIELPNGRKRSKNFREKKIPNYNTVNRDLTAIRAIFNFAKEKKLISLHEIPEIRNLKKPKSKKGNKQNLTPSFTTIEMNLLIHTIGQRGSGQKNKRLKRQIVRFAHYVMIMSTSGMRASDIPNLKIKHCHINETIPYILAGSKGNEREVIPLDACWVFIQKMINHNKKNASVFGWHYSDDMNLFSDDYGEPIASFITQLTTTLKMCGLEHQVNEINNSKRSRNLKSFRPYYITSALKAGVPIERIAKNVGNSPSVIREHYDRLKTTEIAEELKFNDLVFDRFLDLDSHNNVTGNSNNKIKMNLFMKEHGLSNKDILNLVSQSS